jgi:hypothetical protein
MTKKIGVIFVLVILSFFINLLYYVCWTLTESWLVGDKTDTTT